MEKISLTNLTISSGWTYRNKGFNLDYPCFYATGTTSGFTTSTAPTYLWGPGVEGASDSNMQTTIFAVCSLDPSVTTGVNTLTSIKGFPDLYIVKETSGSANGPRLTLWGGNWRSGVIVDTQYNDLTSAPLLISVNVMSRMSAKTMFNLISNPVRSDKLFFSEYGIVNQLAFSNNITNKVAGGTGYGYNGDGGLATNAQVNNAQGVAVDASGNLFIADTSNHRIRKVVLSTGIISTVAGTGIAGYIGDGGLAVNTRLNAPQGVAVDASGNLFIADTLNRRIRMVDFVTKNITSLTSLAAGLIFPRGIALDASGTTVFIADTGNHRILKVVVSTGIVSPVAGNGTAGYDGENVGALAGFVRLDNPCGVAVDASGTVFIADTVNNRIRKVSDGIISTIAGTGIAGYIGDGGLAINAKLNAPEGVAVDGSGNLFIADTLNNCIRKVVLSTGIISTVYLGGGNVLSVGINASTYNIAPIHKTATTTTIALGSGTGSFGNPAGTATFGAAGSGGTKGFFGAISEIIVYNRSLNTNEEIQVQGYLADKWGMRTSLFTDIPYSASRFSEVRPFQRQYVPTDNENLQFWLDGADRRTQTLDGGNNLTTWTPKVNTLNLTPFTTGVAPPVVEYSSSNINSVDIVYSDASNKASCYSATSTNVVTSLTVFVLVRLPTVAPGVHDKYIFSIASSPASSEEALGVYSLYCKCNASILGAGLTDITLGQGSTIVSQTVSDSSSSSVRTPKNYTLLTIVFSGTGTSIPTVVYINGTLSSTLKINNPLNNVSLQRITIGNNKAFSRACYSRINEFMIFQGAMSTIERQKVEGYFLKKWDLLLSNTHPFWKTPPQTVTPFEPRTISAAVGSSGAPSFSSSLASWYDFSDRMTYSTTPSGSIPASTLKDKSNQNNHLSIRNTSNSATQPFNTLTVLQSDDLNYLPYMRLSGLNGVYAGPPLSLGSTLSTVLPAINFRSIFIVCSLFEINNPPYTILKSGTTSVGFANLGGTFSFVTKINNIGPTSSSIPYTVATNGVCVFASVWNTTTPYLTLYMNGVASTSTVATSITTPVASTLEFIPDSNPFTGRIGEILMFNAAVTDIQRIRIEGYLAWKWGIQSKLSPSHPYYAVRP